MKKLLTILLVVASIATFGQSQGYKGLYFYGTQYMRAPYYFIGTTSITDTAASISYVRSMTANSANWNTAYSWGDHAGLYKGKADSIALSGFFTNNAMIGGINSDSIQINRAVPFSGGGDRRYIALRVTPSLSGSPISRCVGIFSNPVAGIINYSAIFMGGNVGVKTESPVYDLDVVGSVNFTHLYQNGELRDTANTSHAGFLTPFQYNKLQNSTSKWTLSGSDIYRLSKVGIGTITPREKLELFSETPDSVGMLLATSTDDWGYKIGVDYNGNLRFSPFYNSLKSPTLVCDLIGNVGIGRMPSYKLDVNGSINGTSYYLNGVRKDNQWHDSTTIGISNGLTRTGKQVLNLCLSSSSTTGALSNTDWSTFNGKIGGSLTSGYLPYATGANTLTNSPIQTDGTYTGIGGASNSSYMLKVTGSINSTSSISATGSITSSSYFGSATGGFTNSSGSNTTVSLYPCSTTNSLIRFGVGNNNSVFTTEWARFTGAFLGIGTTSPYNMLHINDGANATYVQVTNTATGSTATDGSKFGIETDGDLAIIQQENDSIKLFTNSTLAASINGAGYLSYKGTFANMYIADNTTPVTIPAGTSWTKVTGAQQGEYSNMTCSVANSKITTVKAGRYEITLSMTSKTNTANTSLETCVYIGGSRNAKLSTNRELINADKYIPASVTSIVSIPASTDIEVYTRHDKGSSIDLTVYTGNISVEYIGE